MGQQYSDDDYTAVQRDPDDPFGEEPVPPYPQEPAFGSPEAPQQSAGSTLSTDEPEPETHRVFLGYLPKPGQEQVILGTVVFERPTRVVSVFRTNTNGLVLVCHPPTEAVAQAPETSRNWPAAIRAFQRFDRDGLPVDSGLARVEGGVLEYEELEEAACRWNAAPSLLRERDALREENERLRAELVLEQTEEKSLLREDVRGLRVAVQEAMAQRDALQSEVERLRGEAERVRTERVIPLACLLHDVAGAAGVSDIGSPAEVSARILAAFAALTKKRDVLADAMTAVLRETWSADDFRLASVAAFGSSVSQDIHDRCDRMKAAHAEGRTALRRAGRIA